MHLCTTALLACSLAFACSSKRERDSAAPPAPPAPVPAKAAPTKAAPEAKPAVALSEAWWAALPELPPGTFDVSISTGLLDGPPEQQWSWAAGAMCVEDDLFNSSTPDSRAHVREGLRCGRALVDHLPAGVRSYVIDINRPAHPHPLPLFALPTTYANLDAIEPLLVGFHREPGEPAMLCRTFDPSPQTCAERHDVFDKAIAVIDGHVIAGPYVALAELLHWSERDRVLALLPQLPARPLELDLLPRGTTWVIGRRRWLPYSESEAEAFAEVVHTQARAVSWDREWGAGSGSITIVPRCSKPACPERAELATALRGYQQSWVTTALPRMRALMVEDPGPEAECARPVETAMIAQVTHAEVTAKNLVELSFSLPPGRFAELDKARPASCKAADDKRIADGVARVQAIH